MLNLNNVRIGVKLQVGFLVVSAIAAVNAIWAISNFSSIDRNDRYLYEKCTMPVAEMGAINTSFGNIRIQLRGMLREEIPQAKKQEMYDKIRAEEDNILKEQEAYKTTIVNDADGKNYESLVAVNKRFFEGVGQVADLALQDNVKEAWAYLDATGPAIVKEAKTVMAVMVEDALTDSKITATRNAKETKSAQTAMLIILLVGGAIGGAIGVYLTRHIAGPVKKCLAMMQELGKGHLHDRVNIIGRDDEIGLLSRSLDHFADDLQDNVVATIQKIGEGDLSSEVKPKDDRDEITPALQKSIASLRGLIEEIENMSRKHDLGDTDVVIDATKFNGAYREMAEGVNTMVGGHLAVNNKAMACVAEFGRGNFDSPLERFPGKKAIINNTIEQVRANITDFIQQMKNMARQHDLGDTEVMITVNKFHGAYREMAEGVNKMVAGHMNGVKKAMACVGEMGKGNFTAPLDKFPGKKAIINETIEKVRSNIKEVILQMKTMSSRHDEGDIDALIPVGKFQGAYKEMADGVNKMVGGHITLMKKTMECIAEFGKGNFDAPIEKFPGKKAFINQTVEAVRDNLKSISAELNHLIASAKQGDLGKRVNAANYSGDWQNIIMGLNEILDTIVNPINEAAAVLDKVAARDLKVRVTGDYRGDLAKIKDAINMAVETLDRALCQVRDSSEQVAEASRQIASGSQSLAQGANEQASSLEEVSSSLEEMSSMTKQNADNAVQAKNLAAEATGNAAQGSEAMENMSDAIGRIKESSDQTAKIVKTIDEIAMQTNLLALNAAVEAARAGEAGRGFAVVAEEVRNLAQRSAQAAKNTADMISESVKNAEEGVRISTNVAQSFSAIAVSSQKVNDLINEIAAASQEQSQGIDQLNKAVAQMDKVTQQNAANSEESASAAAEMNQQAGDLQSMIAGFNLTDSDEKKSIREVRADSLLKAKAAAPVRHAALKMNPEEFLPMKDEVLREF